MKRAILAAFVALVTVAVASEAFALSFSVDVPVQYTFSEEFLNSKKNVELKDPAVTDVNGFILGASAGWLGVGYENYEVNGTGKFTSNAPPGVSTIDFALRYQLYDVFLDLPLPLLHAVVGYGQGKVSTNLAPVLGQKFHADDAGVSQAFVRLGIPIGPLLDFHLGYNQVKAEDAKVPNGGGGADKLKLSGSLLTAGLRLGW